MSAAELCKQQYSGGKGCNQCPIHPECTAQHQWSWEGQREWLRRCDEAANKYLGVMTR